MGRLDGVWDGGGARGAEGCLTIVADDVLMVLDGGHAVPAEGRGESRSERGGMQPIKRLGGVGRAQALIDDVVAHDGHGRKGSEGYGEPEGAKMGGGWQVDRGGEEVAFA